MKIITDSRFTILYPDNGKVIATVDREEIFEGEIYLSRLDSVDNYIEIDIEEIEQ